MSSCFNKQCTCSSLQHLICVPDSDHVVHPAQSEVTTLPPAASTSCRCVPGRQQRSNQWVMCPDYNQLPMGHLQRAPEEMERGSSTILHGVITSWDSMVSSPFLWRLKLKDKPVNNSASPVSSVGASPNHWSLTGGVWHPKLYKSTLVHIQKHIINSRTMFNKWEKATGTIMTKAKDSQDK